MFNSKLQIVVFNLYIENLNATKNGIKKSDFFANMFSEPKKTKRKKSLWKIYRIKKEISIIFA